MFFYLFDQLSRFHIPDKISLVEIVACSGDGEVSVEVVYQTEMGGSILLFINQDILFNNFAIILYSNLSSL